MKTSQFLVLGVAVAAAGAAGLVAKNLTKPSEIPQISDMLDQTPAIELSQVLVASQRIPMGEPMGTALRWQDWPTDAVNPQYITRSQEPQALEKLQRAAMRVEVEEGEPVRKSRIVGEGTNFMATLLPSGKRAVALSIKADTAAGGFILPNDKVDVIMSRNVGSGTEARITSETILKNIRVLAIDQAIQEDEEGQKVRIGETATLELTPRQAEVVAGAKRANNQLMLVLRSISDSSPSANGDEGNNSGANVTVFRAGKAGG